MTINFQNEWIVAFRDEKPLAMTPDLICVLNSGVRRGGRQRDRFVTASASR